jgi:thiol:disulfide interchange protein
MSIDLRRTRWAAGALTVGAAVWLAVGLSSGAAAKGGSLAGQPDCAASIPTGTGALCKRSAAQAGGAASAAERPTAAAEDGAKPRMLVEVVSRSCSACRRMEPVVKQVSRRCASERLRFEQRWVDDDEGAAYARRHAVFGVPTFLLLDETGREVTRLVGEQPLAVLEGAMRDFSGGRCGS